MEFTMDANRQYNDIVQKVVVPMMKFATLQLNTFRPKITSHSFCLRMSHLSRSISKSALLLSSSHSLLIPPFHILCFKSIANSYRLLYALLAFIQMPILHLGMGIEFG